VKWPVHWFSLAPLPFFVTMDAARHTMLPACSVEALKERAAEDQPARKTLVRF
jgi:hypothetical protein